MLRDRADEGGRSAYSPRVVRVHHRRPRGHRTPIAWVTRPAHRRQGRVHPAPVTLSHSTRRVIDPHCAGFPTLLDCSKCPAHGVLLALHAGGISAFPARYLEAIHAVCAHPPHASTTDTSRRPSYALQGATTSLRHKVAAGYTQAGFRRCCLFKVRGRSAGFEGVCRRFDGPSTVLQASLPCTRTPHILVSRPMFAKRFVRLMILL
mmetsp:Transcript_11121/g.19442  ORF Transcript_11121/g.19442 Transcript_11121/m.19442 type:complete len:206 (-) Transcript_11121:406-1023(-)